jgi:hypothetical protein
MKTLSQKRTKSKRTGGVAPVVQVPEFSPQYCKKQLKTLKSILELQFQQRTPKKNVLPS